MVVCCVNWFWMKKKIPSLIYHVPWKNPIMYACQVSPISHSLCDTILRISSTKSASWDPQLPFQYQCPATAALIWLSGESKHEALPGIAKRSSYTTSTSNIYTGSITIKLDMEINLLCSPPVISPGLPFHFGFWVTGMRYQSCRSISSFHGEEPRCSLFKFKTAPGAHLMCDSYVILLGLPFCNCCGVGAHLVLWAQHMDSSGLHWTSLYIGLSAMLKTKLDSTGLPVILNTKLDSTGLSVILNIRLDSTGL